MSLLITDDFRQLLQVNNSSEDPGRTPAERNYQEVVVHLTQKQVEDYCQKRLEVGQLLRVSDHLGECESCRQRIETAMKSDEAFFALREEVFGEAAENGTGQLADVHLSSEQRAEYVDRKLSGEQLQSARDHLLRCELCVEAVEDLQAFRDEIAPSLDRKHHPAAAGSTREGRWDRAVAFLSTFFGKNAELAYVGALAVLMVAVAGWMVWPTPQSREPRQQIVVAADPATKPAPEPAAAQLVAQLVAQLNDGGGRLTLDERGMLSGAGDLPSAYQSMVKEALSRGRIERSSHLKGLSRVSSPLMGGGYEGKKFSVIEPIGKVVMTDRPTLRWTEMEGASGYVVEVYDSRFNLVAASERLTSRRWETPALRRGKVYSWQVKAIKEGEQYTAPRPPEAQAKFRVLEEGKAKEIEKAKRAYARSHLVLGLLYAEAGMLKEAEEELRALQKANPESERARSLLRQVQLLRRLTE